MAAVNSVCTASEYSIDNTWFNMQYPWDIHFYYSFVSAPNLRSTHNYTCDWNQLSLLFPTRTYQYAGSFLCLDMEAVLTLALVKPQCTKSTMPNICNLYKNPHPHIGHLKMKTDNSLNVNWLYSPNIKHKNHMGNIEIQIEVT